MLNRLNELYHYNRSRMASVDILFCEGWRLLCDRKNLKVDLHGHLYPCVRHLWLVQDLSFKFTLNGFQFLCGLDRFLQIQSHIVCVTM